MLVDDGTRGLSGKAIGTAIRIHKKFQQLKTYLRLSGIRVGLLINFNVPILRHGVRRVMLEFPEPTSGNALQS
jgi:PD-(D/E)XK nuclease superfamily protein